MTKLTALLFLSLVLFANEKSWSENAPAAGVAPKATPAVSVSPAATVAAVSTTPSGTPTASVAPTVPPAPLTEAEQKKLISEFNKANANQLRALSHQERSAMKEIKSAQNMKQRRWRDEQKKARQKYFDEHMSGPERREYVQKYLKDKQAFDDSLKTEMNNAKSDWHLRQQNTKTLQKEREKKFHEALSKGIRPPADLWP